MDVKGRLTQWPHRARYMPIYPPLVALAHRLLDRRKTENGQAVSEWRNYLTACTYSVVSLTALTGSISQLVASRAALCSQSRALWSPFCNSIRVNNYESNIRNNPNKHGNVNMWLFVMCARAHAVRAIGLPASSTALLSSASLPTCTCVLRSARSPATCCPVPHFSASSQPAREEAYEEGGDTLSPTTQNSREMKLTLV